MTALGNLYSRRARRRRRGSQRGMASRSTALSREAVPDGEHSSELLRFAKQARVAMCGGFEQAGLNQMDGQQNM